MSVPISASTVSAVRRCTPGIVQSNSTAAAKGRSFASTSSESSWICSSRKSRWARIEPISSACSESKRLRYRLLHVAGRLTRHARRLVLHLPRHWPWQVELLAAFQRLRALPQPP